MQDTINLILASMKQIGFCKAEIEQNDLRIEVYSSGFIRVHANGGEGCSHTADFSQALRDASNDSWQNVLSNQA
jgi:hypothetical protein